MLLFLFSLSTTFRPNILFLTKTLLELSRSISELVDMHWRETLIIYFVVAIMKPEIITQQTVPLLCLIILSRFQHFKIRIFFRAVFPTVFFFFLNISSWKVTAIYKLKKKKNVKTNIVSDCFNPDPMSEMKTVEIQLTYLGKTILFEQVFWS